VERTCVDADLIIEKLRECQEEIDNWEGVRVNVIETADFRAWQDRVKKWLKAAGPPARRLLIQYATEEAKKRLGLG
jgi:hypothetical protein